MATGKRILVIDDDKDIHAVLRALLGKTHKIFSAYDAVQGSMFARQNSPDLVILDINLPGGGGEKVYERLRNMAGAVNIPVLVYTGLKREQIEAPVQESEDTVLLFKPATPEAILAATAKLLGPA